MKEKTNLGVIGAGTSSRSRETSDSKPLRIRRLTTSATVILALTRHTATKNRGVGGEGLLVFLGDFSQKRPCPPHFLGAYPPWLTLTTPDAPTRRRPFAVNG